MQYRKSHLPLTVLIAVIILSSGVVWAESLITNVPQPAPNGIDVNPLTRLVYVANSGQGTVGVIDERTNTQTATIPVGIDPVGVVVNPVTSRLYVSDIIQNLVYVVNTQN